MIVVYGMDIYREYAHWHCEKDTLLFLMLENTKRHPFNVWMVPGTFDQDD